MPADRTVLQQVAAAVAPTGATLSHLGTGGFASTYKVTEKSGEIWALKVVDATQSGAERTERELSALQAVRHPNIVGYRGTGTTDHHGITYRYLAMDYIEGHPLAADFAIGATYSRRDAVSLIQQAVSGLTALWDSGIAHRDLSPNNILVTADGDLVIADLGMARALDDDTITTLPTPGTPGWMSPEQVGTHPTHGDWRSDQFVLGLITYRLVTGVEPFTRRTMYEAWIAPDQQRPRSPRLVDPTLPPALSDLIDKMLAKQPHRRYLRPAALAADLERIALTLDIPDSTPTVDPEFIFIVGKDKSFAIEPGFLATLAPDHIVVEPRARTRVTEFFEASGTQISKLTDPCSYYARSPIPLRKAWYVNNVPFGKNPILTGFATPADREQLCMAALDLQIHAGADIVLAPYFYAGNGEQQWIEESLQCAAVVADALLARAPLRDGQMEPTWATVAVSQNWLSQQAQRDTLLTMLTGSNAQRIQLLLHTTQPSFGPLADVGVLQGIADVIAVMQEAGISLVLGRRASEGLLGLALGASGWSTGASGIHLNMGP